MRRLIANLLLLGACVAATPALGATGKVIKVLPHFLDLKGQHTRSPSLFDRDAYQAWLRKNPDQRSGVRYDIQWRARGVTNTLKLRVELRGTASGRLPVEKTLEAELGASSSTSHWDALVMKGDEYKTFGEVTAWRVTLWDGDQLVGEQTSYLW